MSRLVAGLDKFEFQRRNGRRAPNRQHAHKTKERKLSAERSIGMGNMWWIRLAPFVVLVSLVFGQQDCKYFVFNIRFDQFPEDFSLDLTEIGSPDVVWSRGGYDSSYKHKVESDSVCLDPSRCWRVTLYDSATVQDG